MIIQESRHSTLIIYMLLQIPLNAAPSNSEASAKIALWNGDNLSFTISSPSFL